LEFESKVEVLDNGVDTERYAAYRPEYEHSAW
jgi:hypothetical protein